MQNVKKKTYYTALKSLATIPGSPFQPDKPVLEKVSDSTKPQNNRTITGKTRSISIRAFRKVRSLTNSKVRNYKISLHEASLLKDIKFPTLSDPEVSIIIPIYNNLGVTLSCLHSLAEHCSKYSFEIIAVDNGSRSELGKCLSTIPGLVLVSSEENLGFVDGCNLGASESRGSTVVFLNNDTLVLGNWLDSLVSQLDNPDIGLIGSKLIYPDGTLQEAGGIIFNDASGNNYGKYQDSGDFRYNYTADVDYVSGASIAIRKNLFDSLGRFDSLYSPAYYEDTDLAFKVRTKGLRVLYEPKSVVVHIEGATAGTDTASGFKKYQVINQQKFIKRWAKELKRQPSPSSNLFEAHNQRFQKKVLFIDNSVPEPDKDSGSVREWEMLTILRNLGHHVTFWPANLVATLPYTPRLQDMGVEVVYGDKEFINFEKIMKERQGSYTHIFMARPYVASRFLDSAKRYQPKAKIIYDTVDLHYLRTQRQAETEKNIELLKQAEEWKTIEQYLIEKSDTTLVVSPVEKDTLNKMGYRNVSILSNIHKQRSLKSAPSFDDRANLLFIGNFNHTPNVDAMVWFCEHIFPKVKKQIPDIDLTIVGSNMVDSVKALNDLDGVCVAGYVETVEPVFDKTRVFVSPLRYGAGVKGKLGQSICLGLPIVTTSVGSEGMYLKNGRDCLIADDEDSFAQAIVQIYNDKKLWSSLQINAQKTIDKHLSHQAAERTIRHILQS